MAKAVLTTKVDPSYDDLPEERYHFPRTYLNAVRQSLHDWIVYYEPCRVSADLSSSLGFGALRHPLGPKQGRSCPGSVKKYRKDLS